MNKIKKYFKIHFSDSYELINLLKEENNIFPKERKKIIKRISNTRDICVIRRLFYYIDDLSDKEICVLLDNGNIFNNRINFYDFNRFFDCFIKYSNLNMPVYLEDNMVKCVLEKMEKDYFSDEFILKLRNKVKKQDNKLKLTKLYINITKEHSNRYIDVSLFSHYLNEISEPTNDEIYELKKEILKSKCLVDLITASDCKILVDDIINRLFQFDDKTIPLKIISRGVLDSNYYSKIISEVYELTKDKDKINGNNLVFSMENLSDSKDVSKVLSMVLRCCSSTQIYNFIIKNINMLTKEQIYELILKICDEKNLEYIEKLSPRIDLSSYMNDIIKAISNSDKIKYKYWILKEYNQYVKNEDFDKMINDIILSRNMKYICLTAIYIRPSVLVEIFGGFNNLFTYVMKSNLLDKDEKNALVSYMSDIICDGDPDMISYDVEYNLSNAIKKYAFISDTERQK